MNGVRAVNSVNQWKHVLGCREVNDITECYFKGYCR